MPSRFVAPFGVLGFVLVAAACGGKIEDAEASRTDVTRAPPPAPGTSQEARIATFCSSLFGAFNRCAAACADDGSQEGDCRTVWANGFSSTMIDATATCTVAEQSCDAMNGGVPSFRGCFRDALLAAPRTPAQEELAARFCERCEPNSATCRLTFFSRSDFEGVSLMYSDDLVTEMREACLGDQPSCGDFLGCARSATFHVFIGPSSKPCSVDEP